MHVRINAFFNPEIGTLAYREDPDEMPHNASFYPSVNCLQRYRQIFITDMRNLESSTCEMGNSILILTKCMGKSIRRKSV